MKTLHGSAFRRTRPRKTRVAGRVFDSAREARHYQSLLLRLRAREISDLVLQPEFPLACGGKPVLIRSEGYPNGRRAKYVADFSFTDADGRKVVQDVKGIDTPVSRLKRAVVEAEYGVRIELV